MKKITFLLFVIGALTLQSYAQKRSTDDNRVIICGEVYRTVTIGNQTWLAENLKEKIDHQGCRCYDNNTSNVSRFGYLYNAKAAEIIDERISGWHIPSDGEWKELERYCGMGSEVDKDRWRGDVAGKIKSYLKIKFGGNYDDSYNDKYKFKDESGIFRSSTENNRGFSCYRVFLSSGGSNSNQVLRAYSHWNIAMSIRLIKD
jgi:uncharacterized protein (TIGR02145 family)